ncbi:MAG: VOC family protein [Clostridia bacterium]|nr:VOC family protein [Clostridia bacterium]MBQ6000957.1 VOC family protein [Clostridia bacterium]
MTKIKGVHHISLKPKDLAEFETTLQFYRDLLELPVASSWIKPDGTHVAMVDLGNCCLEIISSGTPDRTEHGGIDHFALSTEHVDELLERVSAAGYPITMAATDAALGTTPPTPIRIGFCKGPLGEFIEFFHVK